MTNEDIQEWLAECYRCAARQSDDLSNQNAAIILRNSRPIAIAANRIPDGVTKTEERVKQRPTKYAFIEHAERGAIYQAAKYGSELYGALMVCPWIACADCARAIVLSGISMVIAHKQRCQLTSLGRENVADTVQNRWSKAVADGDAILSEGGVQVFYYDGTIGGVSILVNEQLITTL